MKRFITALPALAAFIVFAAIFASDAALAADAPVNITNAPSAKYELAPGGHAYFRPALGLKASERFDGFESRSRRIEVIVANINAPYDEIDDGFTDAALMSEGVKALSRGLLRINGARGVLIKALHEDGRDRWGKWILLLENGRDTLVVNGIFTAGDAPASVDVMTMLKSVIPVKREETRGNEETSGDNKN
ncbi:hypothetical protein FACS1894216_20740 [Synergistales bacterium]|nr:hypothetical protein FACS1894216_20740 [Synergistales bacterium]